LIDTTTMFHSIFEANLMFKLDDSIDKSLSPLWPIKLELEMLEHGN